MDKKDFCEDIKKILDEHGITKLYHFTHKDNVDSILKNGLFSWLYIEKNMKSFPNVIFGSDDISKKLDYEKGLEDYVRLSFIPNHPMMYSGRDKNDYEVLEIGINAIYLKDNIYSNMNAITGEDNGLKYGKDFKHFKLINFDVINDYNKNLKTNIKYYFELIDLNKRYIQAEVMIKKHIPFDGR